MTYIFGEVQNNLSTSTALGGINIKALLDDAEGGGKVLLDFKDRMGDRIQVFLE